nr:SIR2 family protein [Paenibacillus yonginensis]
MTVFFGEYQKTFRGLPSATYEKVELLKVHGSLDWFLTDDSGVICVPDNIMDSIEMVPLMVTPGIRKYEHTHNEPFRSIIARADSAFENANSILCVGYGFNDNHIQPKLIDKMRQGKTPILIATKKLSDSGMRFIKSATSSTVFGIEEFKSGTRIVFSDKEEIIEELSFWSLEELIKLVI